MLLAISDNGTEMRSKDTRRFMALCSIAQQFEAQTVPLPAERAWGEVLADLAGDLDRIHTRRAELAKQIEEVFLRHPLAAVLVTLVGFGPRTGARILAEIGDPRRVANGGRLAAYAGLARVDRRSGRTINTARASSPTPYEPISASAAGSGPSVNCWCGHRVQLRGASLD